jgi:hypothetical protein
MFRISDIFYGPLSAVFVTTSSVTAVPVAHENGGRIMLNSGVLRKRPSTNKISGLLVTI